MKNEIESTRRLHECLEIIALGLEHIRRGCVKLAQLFDECPHTRELARLESGISPSELATLEKIGRGQLLPEIHYYGYRGLECLPLSEQRRVLDGPVEALVLLPGGRTDKLMVKLTSASIPMKQQLIASDHVRTLDEQRVWLTATANLAAASPDIEQTMPYTLVAGKFKTKPGCTMTLKELKTVVKIMESGK